MDYRLDEELKDFNEQDLIGQTLNEAISIANYNGVTKYRTAREDDVNYMLTSDLQFNRLNFEIDNKVITKVYFG